VWLILLLIIVFEIFNYWLGFDIAAALQDSDFSLRLFLLYVCELWLRFGRQNLRWERGFNHISHVPVLRWIQKLSRSQWAATSWLNIPRLLFVCLSSSTITVHSCFRHCFLQTFFCIITKKKPPFPLPGAHPDSPFSASPSPGFPLSLQGLKLVIFGEPPLRQLWVCFAWCKYLDRNGALQRRCHADRGAIHISITYLPASPPSKIKAPSDLCMLSAPGHFFNTEKHIHA
jgi:hypothetical protein